MDLSPFSRLARHYNNPFHKEISLFNNHVEFLEVHMIIKRMNLIKFMVVHFQHTDMENEFEMGKRKKVRDFAQPQTEKKKRLFLVSPLLPPLQYFL